MQAFFIPNALKECPICLAANLQKQPSDTATTLRLTVCNQGILSIDFGFMVEWSKNTKRHHNLIGLSGEICYAFITADHFSGRLFGNWLANNTPNCPNIYVQMDGGVEPGKSCDIHQIFTNFGYAVEMTVPNSSHQNGPGEQPH